MRTFVLDGAIKSNFVCAGDCGGGTCWDCARPVMGIAPSWSALTLGKRVWVKNGGLDGRSQAPNYPAFCCYILGVHP
jgi:hypothetical protein